jgi:colanic acid/amylovoran biosynthesis glycosyltransferase
MKILIWVNQFPTFSETFIRDQIIQLKKNGIEVKIYCNFKFDKEHTSISQYEEYNLLDDLLFRDDFIVKNKFKRIMNLISIIIKSLFSRNLSIYLKSLNYFKYGVDSLNLNLFYFSNYLLRNDIKIIHAHFGDNGNKAAVFKELGLPIKLFTTFHGYDIRLGIKNGGIIYSKLFKYGDKIFSISNYNKNHLILFGAPKHKIVDLPNGIDTSFFKRNNEYKINKKIQILSVSRLVPEKGLMFFLRALILIKLKYTDFLFDYLIIGDGPLKIELENYIEENNLSENINLLGSKNTREVRDFLILSDVFVLPSIAEAFPTVLLEAQSCSLPILATNVGSVKEMLPHSIIVEPNNVEALVIGFEKYLENKKYWIDVANGLRENICYKYDIKIITKQLIFHYRMP